MNELQKEEEPVVINLSNKTLDESFLRMFGFWTKKLLNYMFGGSPVPVSIKGKKSDVEAFSKALGSEKRYMDSLRKYGLDNPKTFKDKTKVERAVKEFTRKTGLKWPFK